MPDPDLSPRQQAAQLALDDARRRLDHAVALLDDAEEEGVDSHDAELRLKRALHAHAIALQESFEAGREACECLHGESRETRIALSGGAS